MGISQAHGRSTPIWSLAIDAGRKDAQAQIKEPEDNHLISGVAALPAVHVRTIFPAIPLLATVST
jgi:hypothetical protein